MAFWYICLVKTGEERYVASMLNKHLANTKDYYQAFVPTKEKQIKRQGIRSKEKTICFPGYIFIESNVQQDKIRTNTFFATMQITQLYKFIDYGDNETYAMSDNEKSILVALMDKEYCIKESVGVYSDGAFHIMEGALASDNVTMKHVDFHNRIAKIELSIMGETRMLTLGFDCPPKHKQSVGHV